MGDPQGLSTMAPRHEDAVDGPQSWVSGRPGQTFLITTRKKITCLTLIPTTCAHACEYAHVTEYICIYIHTKKMFHAFIHLQYLLVYLFISLCSVLGFSGKYVCFSVSPQFQDMSVPCFLRMPPLGAARQPRTRCPNSSPAEKRLSLA